MCNKRGVEGCVVSNESIGLIAVSLWEPSYQTAFELASERSILWVAVSRQQHSIRTIKWTFLCKSTVYVTERDILYNIIIILHAR